MNTKKEHRFAGSIFWRFFITTACIVVIMSFAGIFTTSYFGRKILNRQQQEAGLSTLRSVVNSISDKQAELEKLKNLTINNESLNISDNPAGYEKKQILLLEKELLKDLREHLREIKIGNAGYVYIFDKNLNMLAHPLQENLNYTKPANVEAGKKLGLALMAVSEKPWGKNIIKYMWNRPGKDRDNLEYKKISWCTREPVTGWYVAASAYADEVNAPLREMTGYILNIGIITMILLGAALVFQLRNMLKPIKELSHATGIIRRGDLNITLKKTYPGEIGRLSKNFQGMVESLKSLRVVEQSQKAELALLNKDLESKVRDRTLELKTANSHLTKLDELKSSFIYSVSHELRTPLTSILGFSKLVFRDFKRFFMEQADETSREYKKGMRIIDNLDIINSEGLRLTRLINDVLDLSKIESGKTDWRDSDFDVKELVEECIRTTEGEFLEKPDVKRFFEIEENLPGIHADRDKFKQILINLINNAIKFTDDGYVKIEVKKSESGQIRFCVSDTGQGIPGDELDKIFLKFYQARRNDLQGLKTKGTGLGLSICRDIIKHYRGHIWAESEEGKGSCFIFELEGYDD